MSYVINPYAQWKLPVFPEGWREACESCCYSRQRPTGAFLCRHPKAAESWLSCMQARETFCQGASERKERIL